MTLTSPPPTTATVATTAAPGADAPGAGGRGRLAGEIAGSVLTALTIMLLVFVAEMAVLGPVRHARDQSVLYQDFRSQLADAVAPTGQLDADGKPLALGAPVALLTIPSLHLREVVTEGTTSGVLMSGPGHRRDSPLPGQPGTSVIMGRQATYGGPFGGIKDLEVGAEIAVTTGQGSRLFKVTGIRHAGDRLTIKDPNAGRLTLITGDGTPYLPADALRVDAELVSPVFAASARPITPAMLPKSEQAMSGDTGALLPLLLWSQLLLLVVAGMVWVRSVWGRWQSWIVAVPVVGFIGFQVAGLVAQLLPNLL
ncbi:sortase domain-containing protein [Marmoricola sp. RAF53]|uniref:sortase domain-containing protein n=1 Tax=Marmoricola sp. RAF53 TaxID=3233059 RepID=UPI003F956C4C